MMEDEGTVDMQRFFFWWREDMYSFDVFDTLISRTTATPRGIFALMKDRLIEERNSNGLDAYVIDNFFELRIHGEELARNAGLRQGVEEVTLHDIYEAVAVCGCLKERQIEYLYRLEQETEIANVIGIDENIRKLKELLGQGERVVLISDMYLPEETIREMLLQADDIFEKIPLYVSSEYCSRKTTGNLYRLVQKMEQVSFEDWTHIGDNLHQDIEIPFRLGIKVELVSRVRISDFERDALQKYGDDSRLQLMIGTALRTERIGEENKAYHIGCRYAGPLLYSYAEWIVEQAVKKNIRRLYFIARDGYLVKKITDMILEREGLEIATRYIYGSRKAWRLPSLSQGHYNLYQLIRWSHHCRITTLEELATVLRVSLQDLYEYLPGTYAKNQSDTHISDQELEYIVWKLSGNERFRDFHLQKLEKDRVISQKYLFQEIDITDDNFAFVDASGSGLTQGCLRELIKDRYEKPIRTFFFRIDRVNLMEGSLTDVFMPSFLDNNVVIEMVCRAPHGQTQGYMETDGKVVPILDRVEDVSLAEQGFYEYESGIMDFSRTMWEVCSKFHRKISSMRNLLLYLEHIGENPSREVLEYFASMPSSESGRSVEVVEYAPRLNKKEIKEIFLGRTDEPIEHFYKGTYLKYSIMRASEEEKALIDYYKKEHGGIIGKLYRQEKEREKMHLRERYARAAFYPVRLLEERIVLYGAGKFGQDLHKRLVEDEEHRVVLWVDKNAAACRRQGLPDVRDVSEVIGASYDQVVIAVKDKELAAAIREELQRMGIAEEKIVWLQAYDSPNQSEWKHKGIG